MKRQMYIACNEQHAPISYIDPFDFVRYLPCFTELEALKKFCKNANIIFSTTKYIECLAELADDIKCFRGEITLMINPRFTEKETIRFSRFEEPLDPSSQLFIKPTLN